MEGQDVSNGKMDLEVAVYGTDRKEKASIRYDGNYGACRHCNKSFAGESPPADGSTPGNKGLVYLFDREGYISCAGACYDEIIKGIFPSFFVVSVEELSRIRERQKKIKSEQEPDQDIGGIVFDDIV